MDIVLSLVSPMRLTTWREKREVTSEMSSLVRSVRHHSSETTTHGLSQVPCPSPSLPLFKGDKLAALAILTHQRCSSAHKQHYRVETFHPDNLKIPFYTGLQFFLWGEGPQFLTQQIKKSAKTFPISTHTPTLHIPPKEPVLLRLSSVPTP